MYWGFCSHLGTGLTQNGDATFIHYVTDGKLRPSQGRRGVGFPKESKLHIDLTDIVSLLCVQQAPDDPPSRVASSTAIYNEMLKRNPKALPRLYEGLNGIVWTNTRRMKRQPRGTRFPCSARKAAGSPVNTIAIGSTTPPSAAVNR